MKRGWWKGLVVPAVLVIAWEVSIRLSETTSMSLAPPSEVIAALARVLFDGSILSATRDTLISAGAGLIIGGVFGLVLGILFGLVPLIDRLMDCLLYTSPSPRDS